MIIETHSPLCHDVHEIMLGHFLKIPGLLSITELEKDF